ncbi:CAP domain-containing protein [Candidatus Saccharibacteria bacterium]|nr:MAG: CAP domain-containing protein [Candidatus Saccharibacteria bacterium]
MPSRIQKQTPRYTKKSFWAVMLAVIGIGSIIVYANAATDYRAEFVAKGNIAMSYVNEKPVSITQDENGIREYTSRPRTIDVSKTANLYCTPEDKGSVTLRKLSDTERQGVISLIDRAKSEKLPAGTDANNQTALVNDYRGIFIRDMGLEENSDIYTPDQESPLFLETVAYLEGLCGVTGEAIQDSDLPQWDLIVPHAKTSMERKNNPSLANRLANAVVPTAHAGGSAPAPGAPAPTPVPAVNYYAMDVDHENALAIRFIEMRVGAGRAAMTRITCLDIAAREWARQLAARNVLQHSSPIAHLPVQFCGNTWMKIGENVGVVGIPVGADRPATENAARIVMDAYWNSPGHRNNILDPAYNFYGFGAWRTSAGNAVYNAHVFWQGTIKK